MDAHVKVSGTWKTLEGIHVKVSGVWKEVQTGYIKVSGVWKEFYSLISYALSGEAGISALETQPATAYAGIRINADGTIDKRINSVYTQIDVATDWGIPNGEVTGDEEFYCTDNNANIDGGSDATGSWITAPAQWYVSSSGVSKSLDLTIQVRPASGEPAADSGEYTGNATSEP